MGTPGGEVQVGHWGESWKPHRSPFSSGFSSKSQHAMQESFKQRRGGPVATSCAQCCFGCHLSQHPLGGPGGPAGGTEDEHARPERALGGPSEPQILPDHPMLSLAEMLQVSLSLPSREEIQPCHPTEPGFQAKCG